MDRKTILIILLSILLVLTLFYFLILPEITEPIYQNGVINGQLSIINQIQSTGNIPIISQVEDNQTIQWININQICQNIQNGN